MRVHMLLPLVFAVGVSAAQLSDLPVLDERAKKSDIQERLQLLAARPRPYLLVDPEDVPRHVAQGTSLDRKYVARLSNGVLSPVAGYLVGEVQTKTVFTTRFWKAFQEKKADCTPAMMEKYQGAKMRNAWMWLFSYHFAQYGGLLTAEQHTELVDYTDNIVKIVYDSKGIAKAIPQLLSKITGIANFRYHNYHAEAIALLLNHALVFPDGPHAAEYFEYALGEFRYLMDNSVDDGGAWHESPRYGGAVLRALVPVMANVKRVMGIDVFGNKGFKGLMQWMVLAQTPAHKGGLTGTIPGVGDSVWMNEWYAYLSFAAKEYETTDPQFAGELMNAFRNAGSPFASTCVREMFAPSNVDVSIERRVPVVHEQSQSFVLAKRKGHVVLQSNRGGENEHWMFFRSGKTALTFDPISRHEHADQNSFSIFAFGEALAVDPGMPTYTSGDAAQFRSTRYHNTVEFARRVKPNPIFLQLFSHDDMEHTTLEGKIAGFKTTPTLDVVTGDAERQGFEDLFGEIPIPTHSAKHRRSVGFVREGGYYVVRDTIDDSGSLDQSYYLHAIAKRLVEKHSRVVFFHHTNIRLNVLFLDSAGITISTGTSDLVSERGSSPDTSNSGYQRVLKARRIHGKGFLSVIYPQRPTDPALNAVYDAARQEVKVFVGNRVDTVSLKSSWSVSSATVTSVPRHLERELVYAGGPHGNVFDDFGAILAMDNRLPTSVVVRHGERIDRIEFRYASGARLAHGGGGGGEYVIPLASKGETIKRITTYTGQHEGSTRVVGITFELSSGNVVGPFGKPSGKVHTLGDGDADIVGVHGRSGNEVDRLAAILLLQ